MIFYKRVQGKTETNMKLKKERKYPKKNKNNQIKKIRNEKDKKF
jgi:hypothetical protein